VNALQHLRDVTDPEHPYTLEQLNVVSEELIHVSDAENVVKCAPVLACLAPGFAVMHPADGH
jgi:hypothetical protein